MQGSVLQGRTVSGSRPGHSDTSSARRPYLKSNGHRIETKAAAGCHQGVGSGSPCRVVVRHSAYESARCDASATEAAAHGPVVAVPVRAGDDAARLEVRRNVRLALSLLHRLHKHTSPAQTRLTQWRKAATDLSDIVDASDRAVLHAVVAGPRARVPRANNPLRPGKQSKTVSRVNLEAAGSGWHAART